MQNEIFEMEETVCRWLLSFCKKIVIFPFRILHKMEKKNTNIVEKIKLHSNVWSMESVVCFLTLLFSLSPSLSICVYIPSTSVWLFCSHFHGIQFNFFSILENQILHCNHLQMYSIVSFVYNVHSHFSQKWKKKMETLKQLWCCFNHLASRGILNRLIVCWTNSLFKKNCLIFPYKLAKIVAFEHFLCFYRFFFLVEKMTSKLILKCDMTRKNYFNLVQKAKRWYNSEYFSRVSEIKVNLLRQKTYRF